jgi:hypothetical protein
MPKSPRQKQLLDSYMMLCGTSMQNTVNTQCPPPTTHTQTAAAADCGTRVLSMLTQTLDVIIIIIMLPKLDVMNVSVLEGACKQL